jgi:GT2 family glycosyltransferase
MTFEFGVVNYNGGETLDDCIGSILKLEAVPGRVFVFDNASADGSAERVERRFPGIIVIRSERNLGYAGALNRLLERMTADVVVLCNMDIRFDHGWARAVSEAFARHPGADSIASLVIEMTDPPRVNSAGIVLFGDLHAQNAGSGELYEPEAFHETEVLGGYGAVMCFRRSALRDVGFDEDYFLFFEETDFYLRFGLRGHRTVLVPDARVHHHRSLSTRRYSPLKLYYGERNRLTTVFKLLPVWYWPVAWGLTFRRLLRMSRSLAGPGDVQTRMPGRTTILITLLRAWAAAVVRLPGTLRKRRAFWRGAPATPRDAHELVRRHGIGPDALSLR